MVCLKAVEYSFIFSLTVLQYFLNPLLGANGAKVEGLVLGNKRQSHIFNLHWQITKIAINRTGVGEYEKNEENRSS